MKFYFKNQFLECGTTLLRALPAELSHRIGIHLMKLGLFDRIAPTIYAPQEVQWDINVPNLGNLQHPIGLAAGFDKNAEAVRGFSRLGFSFIEVGTVTPRKQEGNPKPRLFRQKDARTLINRMGFNSDGAETVCERVNNLKWRYDRVPLGVNLGKNKVTPLEKAIDDYAYGIQKFRGKCSYFVVNISSPNTPGLRELATPSFIEELAQTIPEERRKTWVKLDPDLDRRSFQEMIASILKAEFAGVILCNTHRVISPEVGGLSGPTLSQMSNRCLEWAWGVHKGALPMVASGGIFTGYDAFQKIIRGASAVQVYTALVYRGPIVVGKILNELRDEMKLNGFESIQEMIGKYYEC